MEPTKSQKRQAAPSASWLKKADDYARHDPTKAVLSAAGVGFLINLLPIGAIVGALASVAFAMARPVLLFLGLLKAADFLCCKSTNQS